MARKRFWMQFALAAAAVAMISTATFAQQRGGGRGGPGGRFSGGGRGFPGGSFFGGFGGGSVGFALRTDVREELGLTEDQIDELEELARTSREEQGEAMRNRMRELMSDFRNMSEDERREAQSKIRSEAAKANQKTRADVVDALSSKQKKRFDQLEFQYSLQRGDVTAALAILDVDLDDETTAAIAEMRSKISELTRDIQRETLASLSSDGEIEGLMSDPFEFSASGRGQGGRGAREAGRRGSRGGGDDNQNPRRRRRPSGDNDDESPRRNRRRAN